MDAKNDLIRSLDGEGKSLRDIAEAVNLSHVAVKKRLDRMNRHTENPQPDENGRIDTSQYPKLHKAIFKIDDILSDIQRQIGKPIAIETPGGWKIDVNTVNRLEWEHDNGN
ncbi:MAG: AsnC family protein [Candidatus Omnitrophota bacterium]